MASASPQRATPGIGARLRSAAVRTGRAWRALEHEQRWAALAAIGLFISMFLPWYSQTTVVPRTNHPFATHTLTAWGDFSFVEAAVLLVSAGVLLLLFNRAEGRAFHLPGGDGLIILIAGVWAGGLIFYRLLDKPQSTVSQTIGVRWGIFVALLAAIVLAWAGTRVRAARRPEPPLLESESESAAVRPPAPEPPRGRYPPAPGEPPAPRRPASGPGPAQTSLEDEDQTEARPSRPRRLVTREDAQQLSFEDPPTDRRSDERRRDAGR